MGGFDRQLPETGVLLDFWLRAQGAKVPAVSCPLVEFERYLQSSENVLSDNVPATPDIRQSESSSKRLIPLARKWMFDNIVQEDHSRVWICYGWSYDLAPRSWMNTGQYSPMCNYIGFKTFFFEFSDWLTNRGIVHYLHPAGPFIGAVKFERFLPWDGDYDFEVMKPYDAIPKLFDELEAEGLAHHGVRRKVYDKMYGIMPSPKGSGQFFLSFAPNSSPDPPPLMKMRYYDRLVNVRRDSFEKARQAYGTQWLEHCDNHYGKNSNCKHKTCHVNPPDARCVPDLKGVGSFINDAVLNEFDIELCNSGHCQLT
jgi:hypothetical protein